MSGRMVLTLFFCASLLQATAAHALENQMQTHGVAVPPQGFNNLESIHTGSKNVNTKSTPVPRNGGVKKRDSK
jgi:hypothetical protein